MATDANGKGKKSMVLDATGFAAGDTSELSDLERCKYRNGSDNESRTARARLKL